ncbi:methionine ABC transporter extracellular binding protein [Gracilibacillus halophilus YIM-C55.5]|uniref:Lipoprotein n=1 Tax=Gracilibacillus halophilus YIM-C55.5 TaxID=1308866 RepID=N4WIZ4_9BACI|nr:MetQ/NlpA family ABC transporter substrate-binding protein [Gracilibacillus halophilus]ENH96097.1 methionine ABC transporter extracellular binding protein [Gracilibacillus halophilus YIM-C55.5]
MKKLLTLLLATLFLFGLVACGTANNEGDSADNANGSAEGNEEETGSENEETTSITIGAMSVPHAEILEEARPLLKEKGIEIKIEEYQEFVLPNEDLANGVIDANYFQHTPYLEQQMEEKDFDFANLGGIHIEPMGIYSKNIDSLDKVEEGTTVIMSRSVSDHGRILSLLQQEELVKIDEDVDPVDATIEDIVENPRDLQFDASIDAGLLPQFYEREANAIVAINTNYAIEAGLVPSEDALIVESSDSPYANVIAARSEDKDNEALHTLVDVLRSEEIQTFMEEEYDGAIVPVSE